MTIDSAPTDLAARRRAAASPVTVTFVAVSALSIACGLLAFFLPAGTAALAVLVIAQLVFLAPRLRRRLDVGAVRNVVIFAGSAGALMLVVTGAYSVPGLVGLGDREPTAALWMAAVALTGWAPSLVVATASAIVGLALGSPPRWRTAVGAAVVVSALVTTAALVAALLPG
ncbi:hypothetical protein AB0N73_12260 [Microbacterium sp. NPDC089189]|uniref:hypothetical protein n=1 Tax=Microbacterium sp. NPDC089189 TaxID=3154972 RepID=UPI00341E42F0